MRATNIILNLLSLGLVAVGFALISSFFLGPLLPAQSANGDTASAQQSGFNVPSPDEVSKAQTSPSPQSQYKAAADSVAESKEASAPKAPEDKSLQVTIPAMSRIQDDKVPYTTGDDKQALRNNAAIHLRGTGFPWQKEANVYIAGHRIGYPSTESFRTFYDLNVLEKGNKVILTDANGKRYVYRVYKKFTTDPDDLSVTRPVAGKNVVTLQTCTLPFYNKRLIIRAEKVS